MKTITETALRNALNQLFAEDVSSDISSESLMPQQAILRPESPDIFQDEILHEGRNESNELLRAQTDDDCQEYQDECCEENEIEVVNEYSEEEDYNYGMNKSITKDTDIIGYKCPSNLFHKQVKTGTLYIARYESDGYQGFYHPININSKEFDLPSEIVKKWEKVVDGSKGYEMELNRVGGYSTFIRYNADEIFFGMGDIIKYQDLENFINTYETMSKISSYDIVIKTINIGCQKEIYVTSLKELYKRMRELNGKI